MHLQSPPAPVTPKRNLLAELTPYATADTAPPVITDLTLWRDAVPGDIAGETGNTPVTLWQVVVGSVDIRVAARDVVPTALRVDPATEPLNSHEELMVARAGYQVVSETGVVVLDQWTAPSVDFRNLVASGNNARVALTHVGAAGDPEFWVTNPVRDGLFPVDIAWETPRHPDGKYTVRALVADGAGNEAAKEQVVVLDNHMPRVRKVTATPASVEPGQTVTVKIQFSEPVLKESVRVTAGQVVPFMDLTVTPAAVAMSTTTLPGDTWTGTATPAPGAAAGIYQVSVEASDLSGNRLDADRDGSNEYQPGADALDKFVVAGVLTQRDFAGALATDHVDATTTPGQAVLVKNLAAWDVFYPADVLPNGSSPAWAKVITGKGGSELIEINPPGNLHLIATGSKTDNKEISYERNTAIGSDLTAEVRVHHLQFGESGIGTVQNQESDGVELSSTTVFLMGGSSAPQFPTGSGLHSFRLVRTASQISLYLDGTFRATVSRSGPNPFIDPALNKVNFFTQNFPFGGGGVLSGESRWDYAAYTAGAFTPSQLSSPGSFAGSGTLDSAVLDAGQAAVWERISWAVDRPAGTSVQLQTRTGNTSSPDMSWQAFSVSLPDSQGSAVPSAPGRFLQYRAILTSSDGNATPVLREVRAVFVPQRSGLQVKSVDPHVVVESTSPAVTVGLVSPTPAEATAALTAQNLALRSNGVYQVGPLGTSFVVEPATMTFRYPFPPDPTAEARYRLMQLAGSTWRVLADHQLDLVAHQAQGRIMTVDNPGLFAVVEPLDPEAPGGVVGIALSSTSLRWTWTDFSMVESGVRLLDAAGTSVSGDLPANTTLFDEVALPVNTALTRRVEAFSASGTGRSELATRFTLAAPPANLRVLEAQESRVTVAWEANGNPAGTAYVLERATAADAPFVTLVDSRAVTAFRDDGLFPLTTAYYRVRAVNGDGIPTAFSALVSTRTAGFVPLQVEAAPAATSVHLSWHDLAVSTRGVGQHWVVERAADVLGSPGPFTQIVAVDFGLAVPRYTDRGLSPGTTVWYRIQKADFAQGTVIGEPSHPVRAQTAPDTTPSAVTLAEFTTPWLSPTGDGLFEATTISFHLTEQTTYQLVVKNSTGAVVRTLVSRGLLDEFSDGEDEGWRVISGIWNVEDGAYHGNARGAAVSAEDVAVAEVDSWGDLIYEGRVQLDAGDPGVQPEGGLAFRVEATTNPVTRSYYYFRIHSFSGGGATLLKLVNGHEASLTTIFSQSQPIEVGRTYQLRVEAVGGRLRGFVDGVLVHEVEDASPLPAGRVGVRVSGGDESPSLAVFDDLRVLTNGDTFTWDGRSGGGAPVPDGVYTIQIDATDPAGLRTVRPLGTVRVDATPPAAVARLTATPGASVRLFWTPAEDAGLGVARYLVERGTASAGPFVMIGSPTAADLTDTDAALVHGRTFFYRVRGVDFGENAQSAGPVASVTIDTVPPAQITGLIAKPGPGRGEVTLTWTAPGDDGTVGRLVGRYLVVFGTAAGAPSVVDVVAADVLPGTTQTNRLTGFADGTTVFATVQAEDDAGNRGPLSVEVSTRTERFSQSSDAAVQVLYQDLLNGGQPVSLSVTQVSTPVASSALAISTGSGLQLFSVVYDIGPDSSVFSPAAQVTFFYTDPVPPPQETALNVFRFDATTGKWNPLTKLSQDTTANFIVVSLSSTSLYGVFGPADYDPPVSALTFVGPAVPQTDGTILVSGRTQVRLTAQDQSPREFGYASGVDRIFFTLDESVGIFQSPFTVVGADGLHRLTWQAVDRAGNAETLHEVTLVLDVTAPLSELLSPAPENAGACQVVAATTHAVVGTVDDLHLSTWRLEAATGAVPGLVESFSPLVAGTDPASVARLATWDARSRSGWQTLRLVAEDLVANVSTTTVAVFVGDPRLAQTLGPDVPGLSAGRRPESLAHPEAVAIGSDGTRWVADTGGSRVLAFRPDGTVRLVVGELSPDLQVSSTILVSPTQITQPGGLAALPDGGVIVADTGLDRLVIFSATGAVRQVVGGLRQPRGVDVDAQGRLYVADTANHRWLVLASSGAILLTVDLAPVPQVGDAEPIGILRERTGTRVYVSESQSGQVFIYTVDLATSPARATRAGTLGGGPGTFLRPWHLAGTAQGHVYVAERNANHVRKFDRFGAEVLAFGLGPEGAGGQEAAPTRMHKPTGVGVGPNGELAVAVRNDDEVKIFDAPTIIPVVASAPPAPRAAAARPDRSLAHLGPPHDFALGPNPVRRGAPVGVYFVTGWSGFETECRVYTPGGELVCVTGGPEGPPLRAQPMAAGAPGYAPGRYSVSWAGVNQLGSPVASGVYLIQLKVGNPATDEIVPVFKKVLVIR